MPCVAIHPASQKDALERHSIFEFRMFEQTND